MTYQTVLQPSRRSRLAQAVLCACPAILIVAGVFLTAVGFNYVWGWFDLPLLPRSVAFGNAAASSDTITAAMSTTRSWRDVDTTYRNASGIVCDRVPTSFLWESMTLLFYCGYLNHALRYFNVSNNQPVHLTVLYESLCPASLEFVVEHLYPAHEKHGMYFHTELVPYGLAYMNQNGTIKCQHGERECAVDRFQSCVIKNMDNHLPYIYCLSKALLEDENWLVASSSCFDELNVTSSVIQEIRQCNSSNEWEDLARAAFVRKETFFPEKAQHIPWVLFNNVSLKSQQYRRTNLSQSVCSFYVGDNEPASCDGF